MKRKNLNHYVSLSASEVLILRGLGIYNYIPIHKLIQKQHNMSCHNGLQLNSKNKLINQLYRVWVTFINIDKYNSYPAPKNTSLNINQIFLSTITKPKFTLGSIRGLGGVGGLGVGELGGVGRLGVDSGLEDSGVV